MNAPVHRLTKAEIVYLGSHTCKAHRHSYLTHYNCYLKESPEKDKVAILDIETSNLKADYGIILTWCVKPLGSNKIAQGIISQEDIKKGRKGDEDRRITIDLIEEMQKYDKLIGYYSKRFDLPYIRARALNMNIDFPFFGSIQHVDVYDIIKNRFCISRKSQENACRVLLGDTDKTHFAGAIWRDAARGDKKALAEVLEHNIYDVQDLEKLYLKVREFARRHDVSI